MSTSSEPSQDILGDLAGTTRRQPGYPCIVDAMRRTNPGLADQFEKAVAAKRRGALDSTYGEIAAWFSERGVEMRDNTVGVHVRNKCSTCRRAVA